MAITQRDYKPGVFEAFSGVDLGNPTIGVSAYFTLDGYWKFDVADVVLRADSAAGPVLAAGVDYTLLEDEKYTELEANYTGKTLYAKYTVVNAAYTGRPIFVEGNNFGSMMSNEDTKQYIDDNSGGGVQDFIDLNPSLVADPSATEGRFFYNNFERSIQIFTNNPNYWNIPGQADFVRVLNGTGAPITRGQNLDVRDVGTTGGRLVLTAFSTDACDIANNDSKGWAILVATEDIPAGDSGIACFGGTLLNVDTSGLVPGTPVYLGANGEWTNTRPSGCAKYVLIGTAIVADASIGVMGIRVTVDDYDPEFDATILERQEYTIVEGTGGDAGKLFCEVWNKEDLTRDLPVPIGGTTYQLNTTTGPGTSGRARVELIQGTATAAQFNYVYIYENAGVAELAVTAGYPAPPFAVVGRISCWDATRFATDGVLANRRTTSAKVVADRGILSYLIERLGVLPPWVFSGCTPTASITANVMNLVSASGVVYQTLRQTMPQLEVITDGFYIANGPGGSGLANNVKLTDIKEAAGYTTVDTARNTSCTGSLVFYLLINKEQSDCKIMCNLPGELDGTNSASGLRTYRDDRNAAVYSGTEETAFTEFSLCRIPYRFTGGNIEFLDPNGAGTTDGQYIINRINQPMGSAGGSGGGGGALQNLLQVLAEGNSAGNQQIKDLASGTLSGDAVNLGQLDEHVTLISNPHSLPIKDALYSSNTVTVSGDVSYALINTTAGVVNLTLPTAAPDVTGVSKELVLKNAIGDESDLIIVPAGGDTLYPKNAGGGGAVASVTIPAGQSVVLRTWAGAAWFVIADSLALDPGSFVTMNGTQAANDWDAIYNSINPGSLTSIAEAADATHFSRNIYRDASQAGHYRADGPAFEILMTEPVPTGTPGDMLFVCYEEGTAGSFLGSGKGLTISRTGNVKAEASTTREVENPIAWGATPGTGTDSTTAISTALTNGQIVDLQGETYAIADLDIPQGKSIINGTLVTSGTPTSYQCKLGGDNLINNVTFRGKGKASAVTTDIGVYLTGDVSFIGDGRNIISNCRFEDFGQAGIFTEKLVDNYEGAIKVDNCYFEECAVGVWFAERGEYSTFSNNTINGCNTGMIIQGGNNNVKGNIITSCITGVSFFAGANNTHGAFVGNSINHNTTNLRFEHTDIQNIVGCEIFAGIISAESTGEITFTGGTVGGVSAIVLDPGSNGRFIGTNLTDIGGILTITDNSSGGWKFINCWDKANGKFAYNNRVDGTSGVTYSNSWADFGGGFSVAVYKDVSTGRVRLKGLITGGTTTDGTAALTLPAGFRPLNTEEFFVTSNANFNGGTTESPTALKINSSGVLTLTNNATSWTSLNGVEFDTE